MVVLAISKTIYFARGANYPKQTGIAEIEEVSRREATKVE